MKLIGILAFTMVLSFAMIVTNYQTDYHKAKAWDIYNQCLWDVSQIGLIKEEDHARCNQEGHRFLELMEKK